MASDSSEPTRRKHRRSSSPDDADKRSKRRKHRHHHHRHRSKKEKEETTKRNEGGNDEVEVEERKVDCDVVNNQDEGAVLLSTGGFAGVDYDMEEGEILEDDNHGLVSYMNGDIEKKTKSMDSDVESGEIETNRYDDSIMGVNEDNVKKVDIGKMDLENGIVAVKEGGEFDRKTASRSEHLANRDYAYKYHKDENRLLSGDVKRDSNSSNEVEQSHQLKNLSFEKRHKAVTRSHLSRSPEPSRGRSRSRSIIREASILGILHNVEDPCNMERKHRRDSDDERMIARDRNYRHGRDDVRDKDRERSSSRYAERIEGQYSRESRDRYREGSRDRDWDRTREKERKMETDRERTRLRDRGEKERERGRERTVDRDKERERENNRDRERARRERERERDREGRDMERYNGRDGGRGRSQYKDRDTEKDRLSRRQKYDDEDGHRDGDNDYVRRRNYEDENMKSERSNLENVIVKNNPQERDRDRDRGNLKREDDGQEDYQERISIQLAEQEEDDLERVKEESRRRKQAILEKYKKHDAQQNETQSQNMVKEQVGRPSDKVASAQSTQENFDSQVEGNDVNLAEASLSVGKLPLQNGLVLKKPAGTGELGEGTPKSERSDDMFCDDIFGESPAEVRKMGKGDGLAIEKSELHDNWDDAEGYYGYRFGEILDVRYEIIAAQGKGVFSTVVRAKDLKARPGDPEEVAIKIIRNNETMYKAGMEELIILKKLVDADLENKRHCVRFLSNFKYRNHLCLVFESLHMNLREVLKKFGRNIGLKLTAVRTYAKQLFIALKHLKNCGVLHCDIKPDNMLVNEAKNVLKLCDFGNAMFAGKNEITPYLVSRFYRAPEIILGLPYDHPMDIWSVGCCLFEIYSGKVLFPGPSNNDMLRLHMELKGPFPKKMLRKGAFTDQHFDQDLNFLAVEEDPVTKKAIRRLMVNIKPKDFGTLISGSPGEDPKMLANFKDLLEKIFALDPDKRLNVSQALSHPFITGK